MIVWIALNPFPAGNHRFDQVFAQGGSWDPRISSHFAQSNQGLIFYGFEFDLQIEHFTDCRCTISDPKIGTFD